MTPIVQFVILGLSVGALYAAVALGLVLVYKGSGVVNFGALAMATLPLYVYDELDQGRLSLPLPWLPSFEVGNVPVWLCVVGSLLLAAAIGAVVEAAVFRPLRTSPALARVAAAVGVMLTLHAIAALKYGTEARQRRPVLSTANQTVFGASISAERLWLIFLTVVLGGALAVWLHRSRMGLSIQAAAENQRAASLARLSPNALGMVTWTVSTVFTSFIVIAAGQVTSVILPTNLTRFIVPALAVALIARLDSPGVALAAGFVLGALESLLLYVSNTQSWWPEWAKQGFNDALPFVAIVIVLFLVGKSIPTRGDETRSGLPAVILPKNRPWAIALLTIGGATILAAASGSYRAGLTTSLALSIVALSLVLVTGMLGQISFAQTVLAGIAVLALAKIGTAVPFPLSTLLAALTAMIAGLIVAVPALRIRGAQLAVVTLAAAFALERFVFSNPSILSSTANRIPDPSLFGIDLSRQRGTDIAPLPFGLMVLVVTAIVFTLVGNIMRSGTGRKMLAIRSNERAASAIGIDVAKMKVSTFAVASFVAGIGGSLIGYSRGLLSVDSFGLFVGVGLLATGYMAGITSASGALIAGAAGSLGIVYTLLDRNIDVGRYYTLMSGVALLGTVLLNPVGLAGKLRSASERARAAMHTAPPKSGAQLQSTGDGQRREVERPTRTPASGAAVLEVRRLCVRYGGAQVLEEVSIAVRAGEIVGLIGPNGAGKTSLVDAITGFTPYSGSVTLSGSSMADLPPHLRARMGLVRTWQSIELFDDLTVEDNARVADDIGHEAFGFLRDSVQPKAPASDAVRRSLALMRLDDVAQRKPSELPRARQIEVGVARALVQRPKLLVLDEPAAGMNPMETTALAGRLHEIAATGIACLLIDHDMKLVLSVCDRVHVINNGQTISEGTPEAVRNDSAVIAAYLGSDAASLEPAESEYATS